MFEQMLKSYLKKIFEVSKTGDATEVSYYSSLEELLRIYGDSIEKKKFHITTLPKKTEAGNPDFRIWDGKQHIVGYIEAKDPTVRYLDQTETTDQLKRYLHIFPNLILTNFFEFRLYRNGTLIDKVSVAKPFILHKLKTIPQVENESNFIKILEKFFSFSLPQLYDSRTLAKELAKRTRFLKDEVVVEELKEEESSKKGYIFGFYKAFREYLISGLAKDDFADLYSQTITYGLFAARTRSENGFNRKLAYDSIPQTIGILKDVFEFVSLGKIPKQMEWIIDDISEVLAVTDVKNILHQYFHEGKGKDPIVHFYETFLTEYDPKTRKKRGIYYTPESVVSYIVQSLHYILKQQFNKKDGFATELVTVLDPAAGTLTFLAEAAKLAVEEFISKYGEGGKENLIREQILENFYAFELMMAPYAIGHLKMSFLLEELGYKLQKDDRFKLYLTNTLEMEELGQTELPGMVSLSEESHSAGIVKKEKPILVVLGNPPYSGTSANISQYHVLVHEEEKWVGKAPNKKRVLVKYKKPRKKILKTWIGKLIDDYKLIDGQSLEEKNPKWLQDDYVKFIRFAQWKIDQAGEGILGFITNHSYLDNPTFRGMRQSLMNSFDEIYILDLHGNSLKKERCPDGSKDENVFDIQQGVAIGLLVKKKGEKKRCKVYHSDIWGLRQKKYDWLLQENIKTTKWEKILPKSEFYLFVPREEKLLELYEKSPKITAIFPINSVGIVTARDKLTIKWTPQEIWSTVLNFSKLDSELARQAYNLGKDARDWKVDLAKKDLLSSGLDKKKIVPILYRPFDIRYTYYTGKSRGFLCMPRPEVMRHMIPGDNLALITSRLTKGETFKHAQVTCNVVEVICMSPKTSNNGFVFPLYLYPDKDKKDLFTYNKGEQRQPNIDHEFLTVLSTVYKQEVSPEDILYYIYALLYSNIYRTRYAEFLKIDFPRVPFAKGYKLFRRMAECGEGLVYLHLFKSGDLNTPVAKFRGQGDNRVRKVTYGQEKVRINEEQYFDGITEEIWKYQIGGYQVCDKWLKARKEQILSLEDIKQYCRIVTAIKKTIEIQKKIDNLYPEIEKETIEFKRE
jgi:predicted helicase